MEQSFQKPPKVRRLEHPTTVSWELRERVRQLTKVPLWSYHGTTNSPVAVYEVLVGVSNVLRRMNSSDGGDVNARLIEQVHGILLQWLDFTVTQYPQRDITSADETSITRLLGV